MSLPVKTGFPDAITLNTGYVVRFTATDPVTGATVAGVNVSEVSIFGDSPEPIIDQQLLGPFMYVPGPPDATPV